MKVRIYLALGLALTQSAFAEPCRIVEEKVYDCGGVHVVRLAGSPVDRARRMGELVKRGVLSGEVLRYFTDKVSDVAHAENGTLAGPLLLVYHQLVRLFHRAAPSPIAEEIDAMAHALGVDPIVLRGGLSLPDTGVFVHGLGYWLHFLPATGCSSVATPLAGGGFAYGRNLDFAGVGAWDRHPMIAVLEPEPGSKELRHLAIGADGLPFAGITGVNEAGITFAVHQNFSRDISTHGVPMVLIGELVLRSAKTLDEAIEVLRRNRPANLWTFVLNDLRNGESVAVESSSRVFLARRSRDRPFAQTNHAQHAETRERETAAYGTLANSEFRFDRLLSGIEKAPDGVGALAKLLAYQEDPLGQLSAYHDVLKSETIQTVLFEARGDSVRLAVTVDPAPASSGKYAVFSLADLWGAGAPAWEARDYVGTSPEVRQRQRTFTSAYVNYFEERRFAEASAMLASQRTLDAALFRCVAMADAGRYEDSLRIADEALRDPRFTGEPAYVRESLTQVRLIALYRLGRKDEARVLARIVVDQKPKQPALGELARRIANREHVPAWRLAVHFDFFSGDLGGRKD